MNHDDDSPNVPDEAINHNGETARIAHTRAEQGLRLTCANLPWLSGLAHRVSLHVDDRVSVAAVSASGRVLVNPEVFAALPVNEATYIMAHELLHLALDTFGRETTRDDPDTVNRAHDYIINDILRNELGMSPPLGGLDLRGASELSLEQLVAWMNQNHNQVPKACWNWSPMGSGSPAGGGIMSQALRDAGLLEETVGEQPRSANRMRSIGTWAMDLIWPEDEAELFPDDPGSLSVQVDEIHRAAAKALSLREIAEGSEKLIGRGHHAGTSQQLVNALRGHYQTPWEVALQRWMEAAVPGQRTYARPSRRGADRTDCILPGRNREGWTLHVVLDTSGSMTSDLARVLGALAAFCENIGVADVHILQCDVDVTVDEWVPAEELENYRIAGYGGSDMSPAMRRLAEDPEVTAMVVITDGWINYPEEEPPCHVLWVLADRTSWSPRYGEVIEMSESSMRRGES